MFKGSMYIISDPRYLQQAALNSRVFFIADGNTLDPNLVKSVNGSVWSIFLPPYPASCALLDNNIEQFTNIYFSYLASEEVNNYLTILFAALHQGINITLFISNDELNMFGSYLLQYIYNVYGIAVGTPGTPFQFNPAFTPVMDTLLYLNGYVDVAEFFVLYPAEVALPTNVINKLVDDINPIVDNRTLEGYMQYFERLKQRTKEAGKFRSIVMKFNPNKEGV